MQTSIAPRQNSAEPTALLPYPTPDAATASNQHLLKTNQPPPRKPNTPLPAKLVIGDLDLRTPAEEVEFQECETIIREGWARSRA